MPKDNVKGNNFSSLLEDIKYKPHKNIIKQIDSKMFPLDMNAIFSYKPELLAHKEYIRCLELFEKRNKETPPSQAVYKMPGIQKLIIENEKDIAKELQELAINIIKDIYQVPDYIDFKSYIHPRCLNFDTENEKKQQVFLDLTLEQKNRMREEVKKRELFISLIHGSSLHIWKSAYYLVNDKLDKLNPLLKELYDIYTSSIGIGLWLLDIKQFENTINNNAQITQGFSKVKFNRQAGFGATIEAKSINFPVLLHELNKGLINYLFSAGIPKDFSQEELSYYYAAGDNPSKEPWHYLFGPTLWSELLEVSELTNDKIPHLIRKLTTLNYNQLLNLFKTIQDNKEQAKKEIKLWNI